MRMIDTKTLTVAQAHEQLKNGDITAVALAEAVLAVIEQDNAELNAYLEVYDDVREQARAADKLIAQGNIMPLTGIPISVKDNILVKGKTATCSSKILTGYSAPWDATVIADLKAQGAVLIGRTNMDEFAMGSSTETSAFGMTRNPIALDRVPGGSSGGAAAAVAMGGALLSLGSDTGGSIRQPAAFCGLVGLKPTYGAVSRHGLMAMASSLDVIGPLSRTVADAELLFNAIAHHDAYDATTIPESVRSENHTPLRKVIGVPWSFIEREGVDADVLANFKQSIERMKLAGYEIRDIALPHAAYALPAYYIIQPAEVSSNLARYDGVRFGYRSENGNDLLDTYVKTRGEGFGKEVRRRVILGTYVLSAGYHDAYYNQANKARALITKDYQNAFQSVDVIATPTTPTLPFKPGEKNTPLSMYFADLFVCPANIAGVPAISIPSGKNAEGLVYGFHLTAPHHREDILFTVGKDFESAA